MPLSKKVRGHTRKQNIWDLERNERVLVTLNEMGQPVGDEGSELTNFLGTLVKMSQHVSIDVDDWRKISDDRKEDLWTLVKEKFSFVPVESEGIKKWVINDMGSKWKTWKYDLKRKSYDPSLTIDEIVDAQTDSRVDKIQFKKLVTLWFSEKNQAESEKKKTNRSKSNEPHVTGTRSFAQLSYDEEKKNGVPPTRATVYRMSRTRRDGSIVNAYAADVVDKLQEISEGSGTTEQGGVMDWRNDAFAKVKGPEKGGRIRCLGKVVVAKGQGSHSHQDVLILNARISELQDEVKEIKDKRVDDAKEMNAMRETQKVMVQFMSIVKEQLPHLNFSILNDINMEVANDSCSAYEHISDPRNKGKR